MSNKADFTTGSIPKKMIGFMLPILLALVLQSMYSAVDLIIVGHYGTNEGMSAVSTGASIMHLFTIVVTSLSTGVTVLMGKFIGQKTPELIGKLLGRAVFFFSLLSVALTLILIFLARPIAVLMQGLIQSFLIRLPISYFASVSGGGSLVTMGFAPPSATFIGIIICIVYYIHFSKKLKRAET